MVKFTGVNHLAMATRDMDTTIRFWRDLLGLRLVAGLGRPKARLYFFEIAEDSLIGFFEWPEVEAVAEKDHGYPAKGPAVFDHVALGVEAEADLWELKERLEAAGFWVSEVMDHGFIHSIYSFDPNGIPIEFSHPVPGVDIGRQPKMVSRHPSAVALEGPEPQPGKWPEPKPTPEEEKRVYPGEGRELLEEER
jgi:catechol 2,3-dioxygenase-like lactoylglutathione lyase family enzyme